MIDNFRVGAQMFGVTRRQRALVVVVVVLGVATAVTALSGWHRITLAGLTAMTTLAVVVLLDVRTRQGSMLKQVRALARRGTATRNKNAGAVPEDLRAMRGRITELTNELDAERDETTRLDDLRKASYRQSLRQHVRVLRTEDRLKARHKSAALQLPHKLRNLEFAASHGIGVPEVYAVWPDIEAMDLSGLPDTFVLKADGGAGSVAVFPLERVDNAQYRAVGATGEYGESEIRERIQSLGRQAREPYFAEELLRAADGGPIPNDVKCYMFYGEVGQILVRNVAEHGDASTIRLKFVDEQGEDYGPVAIGRTHDSAIEVPEALSEMAGVAKHLSRAIGLPFCRIDLYDTSRGIVLGEITRAPSGGNERFAAEHDEMLGQRWIEGAARLNADLSSGRPIGPLFGPLADLHLYPPSDRPRAAANFRRTVADCSQWCR